jgi:hypothetical protein
MLVNEHKRGVGDHIYLIMMEGIAPPLLPPFMNHFLTRNRERGKGEEGKHKGYTSFHLISYSLA